MLPRGDMLRCLQVAADSKFEALGADSLDTVRFLTKKPCMTLRYKYFERF